MKILPFLLLLLATNAHAEFTIQPRVSIGLLDYEFEQQGLFDLRGSNLGTGLSKITFRDQSPFAAIGLTLALTKLYLDLTAQQLIDDATDEDTLDQVGRDNQALFTSNLIEREWDQEEYAITLGYQLTETITLFAGYRESQTEFEEQNTLTVLNQDTFFFSSELDYEQKGPFIGTTFSHNFNSLNASLSFTVAIADIEGDIEQPEQITIEGDTTGLKLGLNWTQSLSGTAFTYTIHVDGYQYTFESNTDLGADFSETMTRLTLSISYPINF